jgi:hypothetical protein
MPIACRRNTGWDVLRQGTNIRSDTSMFQMRLSSRISTCDRSVTLWSRRAFTVARQMLGKA